MTDTKPSARPAAEEDKSSGGTTALGKVPMIVAILVLVAFGGLVVYMLGQVGESDSEWSRQIYIYGSVEAIVFAAAGGLFGREVNRQRAEEARTDAEEAKKDAKEKTDQAAAGKALAAAVRGQAAPPRGGARAARGGAGSGNTGGDASLRQIADELFPRES